MKTKQFLYAASLLLLTACSSDDVQQSQPVERIPVQLSYSTVQAVDTRAAAAQNLNDDYIASGKSVHVQIATVNGSTWDSYTYTTGDNGAMTAPSGDGTPLYPTDDTNIKILAWYPAGVTGTSGFSVEQDQSSNDGYMASDLMFSNNVTDQEKQVDPVALTFVHKMAKIVINVTSGVGVNKIQSVTLKNVHRKTSFNELTGAVSTDTSDPADDVYVVKYDNVGDATATAAGAAVIPDQTINGSLLEITTDIGTATYSVSNKHFVSGHKYTLNISVSRTTVNTTTAIGTWAADGSVTINSQGSPFMTFDVNGVKFKMVYVEGTDDNITMTWGNYNTSNNQSPNNVSVTVQGLSDYYMGQTEVTNALWNAVMGSKPGTWSAVGTNNGQPNAGDTYPVAYVSWDEICTATTGFIDKLNAAVADQLPTGMKFVLPSEAQWQYAAQGGKYSNGYNYSGSNTINDVAWYGNGASGTTSGKTTNAVATKPANELGLYDMTGNVWEWCQDWYNVKEANAVLPKDYVDTTTASYRVIRGGCWFSAAVHCAVSFRSYSTPSFQGYYLGFRLALQ